MYTMLKPVVLRHASDDSWKRTDAWEEGVGCRQILDELQASEMV